MYSVSLVISIIANWYFWQTLINSTLCHLLTKWPKGPLSNYYEKRAQAHARAWAKAGAHAQAHAKMED